MRACAPRTRCIQADGGSDAPKGAPAEQTVCYSRLSDALATPLGQLPPNCHPLVPVLLGEYGARDWF
jgi:hypothetical protein